jgi:SAM-dependent methyltransferase
LTDDSIAARVRREYAEEAARYDRRWAAYLRGSMELLRPWLAEQPGGALLDVGCGTAVLLDALRGSGIAPQRYVGVDPSNEMLTRAAARTATTSGARWCARRRRRCRSTKGTFDTVVSVSSLHYWPTRRPGCGRCGAC